MWILLSEFYIGNRDFLSSMNWNFKACQTGSTFVENIDGFWRSLKVLGYEVQSGPSMTSWVDIHPYPLLICTWFLKNQAGKIKLEKSSLTNWIFSLQKSILKLIFVGYTGNKNQVLMEGCVTTILVTLFLYFNLNHKAIELNNAQRLEGHFWIIFKKYFYIKCL